MQTVMARPSLIAIHDQHLDGAVARYIAEARTAGLPYEQIAQGLRFEFGISVTTSTVYRWCQKAAA